MFYFFEMKREWDYADGHKGQSELGEPNPGASSRFLTCMQGHNDLDRLQLFQTALAGVGSNMEQPRPKTCACMECGATAGDLNYHTTVSVPTMKNKCQQIRGPGNPVPT